MLSTPRRRRAAWLVIGLLTGCLVVACMWLLVSGRTLSRDNARVLSIVEDCTTPGRECYDRSQRQGAAAVASINRVVVFAAACADDPAEQSVEEIQACVLDALEGDAR